MKSKEKPKRNWWKWAFWILIILVLLGYGDSSYNSDEMGYCVDDCVSSNHLCTVSSTSCESCYFSLSSCVDSCKLNYG